MCTCGERFPWLNAQCLGCRKVGRHCWCWVQARCCCLQSMVDWKVAWRVDWICVGRVDCEVAGRVDQKVAAKAVQKVAARAGQNVAARADQKVAARAGQKVAERAGQKTFQGSWWEMFGSGGGCWRVGTGLETPGGR